MNRALIKQECRLDNLESPASGDKLASGLLRIVPSPVRNAANSFDLTRNPHVVKRDDRLDSRAEQGLDGFPLGIGG